MLQVLQPDGQLVTLQGADPLLDPARLAALRDLNLLDAPPQDALAVVNRLASRLLGVPISALSLISWDRQVTAGQVGLASPDDVVPDEAMIAPLSHSFCQHVVRADEVFAVADAREHELVRDNGAITDSNIVAYAGVPIRVDGQCIGALCACDTKPRSWSDDDIATLRDLSAVAVDGLELQRVRREGGLRDSLTGLPRRALFQERVDAMLAEAASGGPAVTVVGIDLMAFRLFNEAWGHDAGDQILAAVSQRLRGVARDDDAVCRLAGDEFLVAMRSDDEAEALVGQLGQALSMPPISIEGVDQPVAAELVAIEGSIGLDATELIDDVLATLAATKAERTRGQLDVSDQGPAREQLLIRNRIVGAEQRGELQVHYQPLFDLATGRICSLEALLRWNHPELGWVSPVDFIPIAERTGAIVPIGEWVLRQACQDLAAWRDLPSGDGLRVAVNVAPEQVRVASFDAAVEDALAAASLPASALALEITERTILEDRTAERKTIEALRERGVDLHLDDFGTGFSSLGYLTRFPLNVLKVDQVFVARLGVDAKATALVEGIVALADSLGLETVAEGIETEAQRNALRAMGCKQGQGFWFARPVAAEHVPGLLLWPVD